MLLTCHLLRTLNFAIKRSKKRKQFVACKIYMSFMLYVINTNYKVRCLYGTPLHCYSCKCVNRYGNSNARGNKTMSCTEYAPKSRSFYAIL